MKYFTMQTGINEELLDRFVVFFNEHRESPVTIIVHSRGGSMGIGETILHMISEMADVTLIIHSVYSSAFNICYSAECKKILSKSAKGMYHQPKASVEIAVDRSPYYHEDNCLYLNFKHEKKYSDSLAKEIMTKKEYELYVKRDEVWFDFNRMKQIFPDAEVMK